MNGLRQKLGLLFALLLTVGSAESQNVFLKGEYVEVGVHPSGSFGSSSKAPTSYHARGANGKLGFVCDIGKDGWNTRLKIVSLTSVRLKMHCVASVVRESSHISF